MQRAACFQQPEKLAGALTRAGVRHGETVRASIDQVAVYPTEKSATREEVLASLRFCSCRVSSIRLRGSRGDHQPLPPTVDIDDAALRVPHVSWEGDIPHIYCLKNALITTNGSITVSTDNKTRFVRTDKFRNAPTFVPA